MNDRHLSRIAASLQESGTQNLDKVTAKSIVSLCPPNCANSGCKEEIYCSNGLEEDRDVVFSAVCDNCGTRQTIHVEEKVAAVVSDREIAPSNAEIFELSGIAYVGNVKVNFDGDYLYVNPFHISTTEN